MTRLPLSPRRASRDPMAFSHDAAAPAGGPILRWHAPAGSATGLSLLPVGIEPARPDLRRLQADWNAEAVAIKVRTLRAASLRAAPVTLSPLRELATLAATTLAGLALALIWIALP